MQRDTIHDLKKECRQETRIQFSEERMNRAGGASLKRVYMCIRNISMHIM